MTEKEVEDILGGPSEITQKELVAYIRSNNFRFIEELVEPDGRIDLVGQNFWKGKRGYMEIQFDPRGHVRACKESCVRNVDWV